MLKFIRPALVSVLLYIVATGLLFPAVVTGAARLLFPRQAAGTLVARGGRTIGSALIGQQFAAPRYFHPRPSAAGNGYDPLASGGTNLGPTSAKLVNGVHTPGSPSTDFDGITDLVAAYRRENALAPGTPVPADAVTRSASGLDPDISPANALLQAHRVAAARGMEDSALIALVRSHTAGRQLGFLGEPRVNVLQLNLALDAAAASRQRGGQ